MQKILFLLLLLVGFSDFNIYGQVDREFWFAAPDIYADNGDDPIFLRITSYDSDANVQIILPAEDNRVLEQFTLLANSTVSIELNKDDIENTPSGTINTKGLFIVSNADISAYYEVSNPDNSEKFVLKGSSALGKAFFVPSIYNDPGDPEYYSSASEKVDIVATVDNTTIQITPTVDISGHPANVTFELVLNSGETFGLESSVLGALAGTEITSDRVIAVTISDDAVMQNLDNTVGDLIGDQLIPVSAIGTEYIAVNTSKDSDATQNQNSVQQIYVMATEDNTIVVANNSTKTTTPLQKGEIAIFEITDHAIYIYASKPVYAYQITGLVNTTTDYANELGSAILPSYNCNGSNSVSFTKVLDRDFWVNIVVKKKDVDSFILYDNQGNGVDFKNYVNSWAPISGQDVGINAWVCCAVKFNDLAIGEPYTLVNTSGVFHLCILDENGANEDALGSISFGYFSSYNSFWVDGIDEACDGEVIVLSAKDRMESYRWYSEETGDEVLSTTKELSVTTTGIYYAIGEENNGLCSFSGSIYVQYFVKLLSSNGAII